MQANKWLLVTVIGCVALTAALYFNQNKSTIKPELRDFAVKDTAAVTKIFLADKNGNEVLLERINAKEWQVNGKFRARADMVKTLLSTIAGLQVRNPVAKAAIPNVLKDLAGTGQRKVEIYANNKKLKTYYVGSETMDNQGTYMLLEGSSVPFDMHLPGFRGILNVRYQPVEALWRDPALFRAAREDIRSIKVDYPEMVSQSFQLSYDGNQDINITLDNGQKLSGFKQEAALYYINEFRQLFFEAAVADNYIERDSIFNKAIPFAIVELTDKNNKVQKVRFSRRRPQEEQMLNGKPAPYDVDRCYAAILHENILAIAQYYVIDRILVYPEFFLQKPASAENR